MKNILVNPDAKATGAVSMFPISLLPNARMAYQLPAIRTITGSLPGGKRLTRSITVLIEYDNEEVMVSEPLFYMHAAAPTEAEAIEAFKRIFSGYLDSLARREKTLGPQLHDQLNYLRSVIASE